MTAVRVPQASGTLTVPGLGALTVKSNQVDVPAAAVPAVLAAVPGSYVLAAAGVRGVIYTSSARQDAAALLGQYATPRPGARAVRVTGTTHGTVTAYPADPARPGWTWTVLDGRILPAPDLDAAAVAALIPQAVVETVAAPDAPPAPPRT
jgi:hypothetical protein